MLKINHIPKDLFVKRLTCYSKKNYINVLNENTCNYVNMFKELFFPDDIKINVEIQKTILYNINYNYTFQVNLTEESKNNILNGLKEIDYDKYETTIYTFTEYNVNKHYGYIYDRIKITKD